VSEQGTFRETSAPQEKNWANISYRKSKKAVPECFPAQGQKIIQEFLLAQGCESVAIQPCGFLAAATDRAAVNQEAGTYLPEALYFSSSPRRNS